MTETPDVLYLADHPLILALPALVPAFIVAGVVIVIAVRDRRNGDDPERPDDNEGV